MRAAAPAKINLGLVVGPRRDDGKHEVLTLYQRLAIADRIDVARSTFLTVDGFPADTLVRSALEALAEHAGVKPCWRVRIQKRLPVAAGLGGGSSDAATALRLANADLPEPLPDNELHALAAGLGADVPFFLVSGPQVGTGDGSTLESIDLPQDFWVVLVLPADARKSSTASIYEAFDARSGADGFDGRAAAFRAALAAVRRPRDLAALPPNDLASSPLACELRALGAFHAGVSGAGSAVYGLYQHRARARTAERALRGRGQTWITAPAWYG